MTAPALVEQVRRELASLIELCRPLRISEHAWNEMHSGLDLALAEKVASWIEGLEGALQDAKVSHLIQTKCRCGADEHNAKIDQALTALPWRKP